MPWNPDQYDKFKAERTAPVNDLLDLVRVRPQLRVIDLGCGTGEHTRRLADMLPDSTVTGLDSSAEMLEKSSKFARAGLTFVQGRQEELTGEYDLVFSNAALQWSGNHRGLLPRIWEHIAHGGQIVVQMPKNHDHASHALARRVAGELFPDDFPHLAGIDTSQQVTSVLPIEEYAEILFALGGTDITAYMKVYPHVLADSDAIVEWVKGTLLVPFMEKLPPDKREIFMNTYREELHRRFPQRPVFYGFKRVLFSAVKP